MQSEHSLQQAIGLKIDEVSCLKLTFSNAAL